MLYRTLTLASLLGADALLLPAACCSPATRLPASRIAPAYQAGANICMCDAAPAEEAAAAPAAVEEAAAAPKARGGGGRADKTPLSELEVDAEVEGKIRSVMTYGAFVDIGAQTDALLHVSEISNEFVEDATTKLKAGEMVKGRIKAINLEKQQLALTCKEKRAPRVKVDLSKYEGADKKEFVTGKVNSIMDFGAFVSIEDGVDGLVHVSQIQEGGVRSVGDVLTVGQEVQVRIVNVEKSKRRIGLSMIPWSEELEKAEAEGKKRGGRGGGFGGDIGFGSDGDKEFHMNAEELEAIAVGEFTTSPFDAAFSRAEEVKEAKAAKKSYARVVL